MRPTLIVIFDAVKDEMTVVTPVRPAPGVSAKAAYARAGDRLNLAIERLEQPLPHASEGDVTAPHPEPKATTSAEAYMAKVVRAKEYIAAGRRGWVTLEDPHPQTLSAAFFLETEERVERHWLSPLLRAT